MDQEDASSMISSSRINNVGLGETSDSNDTQYNVVINGGGKRKRSIGSNNPGTCSVKFKGVVPQQNGHWGAQIYANHQRIWLGTFKLETEAAMAYDSATIKLRSGDSHRNFPWNDLTVQEPKFQSHYNAEEVLNMIKDGSYQTKFAAFVKTQSNNNGDRGAVSDQMGLCLKQIRVNGDQKFGCNQIFQKELTPSDVGKLNRLVIPKKYAVRYFPYINEENGIEHEVELVFYDRLMRSWKFRYCYWRSSQSFVFTRGWNRFVKDKKLRAKDVISFYTCESCTSANQREKEGEGFCLIDVIYSSNERKGETSSSNNINGQAKEAMINNALENGDEEGLRLFGVNKAIGRMVALYWTLLPRRMERVVYDDMTCVDN